MIFVIDIGNTDIKLGIYQENLLLYKWRISTDMQKNGIAYLKQFEAIFASENINPVFFNQVIVSSVVPQLLPVIDYVIKKLTNIDCLIVDHNSFSKMPINVDHPEQVGTDRLINAFSGYNLYQSGLIVIDCGTATTFDVIDDQGIFQGGVITTGLLLFQQALTTRTSKLPGIKLEPPKNVIGKNTLQSMQSGIIFGYAGMVDSIIDRIHQELESPVKVIATGGLARLIHPVSERIEKVIDDLTLRGLYLISQNIGKKDH
ncbi:MAG: type III pantothenate kinase [Deltaproteobacteria bacterium]|jgi:type III pantothenate kinase|nr:type III pantothenate kinase [Deltaproteobacteria bacterium]